MNQKLCLQSNQPYIHQPQIMPIGTREIAKPGVCVCLSELRLSGLTHGIT